MPVEVVVDDREVRASLGGLVGDLSDKTRLLRLAGGVMSRSIALTFRDQGSPAGSWAALAESTKRKKGYTAGHKLLVMKGILRSSVTNQGGYIISGNTLTIGTNLVYAAVQQYGSADRRGAAIGPQARIAGRGVTVKAHDYMRISSFRRYGQSQVTDKNGKTRTAKMRMRGPANRSKVSVSEHTRHQNIPPRPYLVFRPEDPANIAEAFESYIAQRNAGLFAKYAKGKSVSLGRVGA